MFVLVHSNFDDHSYYYNYRVLSARPHVEASLRDGLIIGLLSFVSWPNITSDARPYLSSFQQIFVI